jgi:AcrR family transcriptional regulator
MRVRTEAKRREILDNASHVFLEQGFERASMSEIAARVGGSKTTLYGYFKSKEELFVAVASAQADEQVAPAFAALGQSAEDLRGALLTVAEALITFLISPNAIAAYRMVMSEAGRSDIGRHFYAHGRERGIRDLASFLERARQNGQIRSCDSFIAATHFLALVESEYLPAALFGVERPTPTRRELHRSMEQVVDIFLAAYGT